jgi:hypothetical protein
MIIVEPIRCSNRRYCSDHHNLIIYNYTCTDLDDRVKLFIPIKSHHLYNITMTYILLNKTENICGFKTMNRLVKTHKSQPVIDSSQSIEMACSGFCKLGKQISYDIDSKRFYIEFQAKSDEFWNIQIKAEIFKLSQI